jgi:UDP-glucose 4-epimerase
MARNHPAPRGCVLVTGGAGFIGSHVVDALLARGSEVRVLDDLSTGSVDYLPLHDPNLELRTGDLADPQVAAAAMRGVRACIHLAAQTGPARPGVDPYHVTLDNTLAFINLLDAARLQRVKRVLFASSSAVYGEAPEPPFTEATAPRPTGPEGIDKLLAEGYAELFSRRYGLRTLALRYFDVYGPRQRARDGVIPQYLDRLDAHRPVVIAGDGHQRRDFIHVEDAARATVAALDTDHCGAINVASGQPTELRELVRLLGYALDLRPLMHFVPAHPGAPAASWGDTARLRAVTGVTPAHSLRAGLAALATDRAAQRQRRAFAARREFTVRPGAARTPLRPVHQRHAS